MPLSVIENADGKNGNKFTKPGREQAIAF